ncbi:ABC exporter membrane fusion protein, DevB family [Halomicronema hongdechloris C2206]|uniref:ABC exporter membrane fusion protein, DevB family n=1 Tax=Halomicronema hongdechloris C2206 TaxID=1641165 RepID=A0A1Z3HL18_9CYAN|nr:HlyD family efflux transporter periplasmic adaptor subunit [Halomicronema hongdechloris]ASC71002.1 ABC exporter membrane fusion protein, DevB family [Halomicronema hongdechloris C2206]
MQEIKLPFVDKKPSARSIASNGLISIASIGLLIWAFQLLQTRLTSVVSHDAVINGAIVEIKAPQEGVVSQVSIATGDEALPGQSLLTLKNDQISELQVEEITGRLNQGQTELQRAQIRLDQLVELLQRAQSDSQAQYRLENLEAEESIDQVASELKGAEAKLQLAQVNYDRAVQLQTAGAISVASLDSATVEVEQRQAEVDSLKNRLNRLEADRQAAALGLVINQTRSNYDPRIRVQELQLQISDQQQLVQTLTEAVATTEAELAQAKLDAERKQFTQIEASTGGVIWSLPIQPGTFVQRGESLGQLLDCNRRWVDAFVDERTLKSLQVGTPATIELYGDKSVTLQGSVGLIRSGLERLSPGEDVAVPTTANTPRNAQIRVNIEPDQNLDSQDQLCYVGYTGKVIFEI